MSTDQPRTPAQAAYEYMHGPDADPWDEREDQDIWKGLVLAVLDQLRENEANDA